jgi:hypothetical protein
MAADVSFASGQINTGKTSLFSAACPIERFGNEQERREPAAGQRGDDGRGGRRISGSVGDGAWGRKSGARSD